MWLSVLLILLVTLCYWDWSRKRSINRQLKNIPGPKITIPLIGDALLFLGVDTASTYLFTL